MCKTYEENLQKENCSKQKEAWNKWKATFSIEMHILRKIMLPTLMYNCNLITIKVLKEIFLKPANWFLTFIKKNKMGE